MFCYPLMQSGSGLPGKGGSWSLTAEGKSEKAFNRPGLPHDPRSPLLGQPAAQAPTKDYEICLPASLISSTAAAPWLCSAVFHPWSPTFLQCAWLPLLPCPCCTPQMAGHARLLTAGLLNGPHPAHVSCCCTSSFFLICRPCLLAP